MSDIHLYIGDTEVEFTEKPEILYTYQVDDLTNPTIVKNSYSKTITIKGTRNNNHLFGHYWNVERRQVGADDNANNIYFNASKKMEFQLFVNSELHESGYVKLNEVRRTGNDYEYDITLYGGLGDFFYNLSTCDDGNKMKLSNLELDKEIDFIINLDTVKEAWQSLKENADDKWKIINFMPSYNGIPDDFDGNKMILDITSTNLTKTRTVDGKTYETIKGWVMAELPDDMTEWETRDLRSYLQRPCIRMKEIINACCNPINNGGYEVELDSDFFNETNPYWEKTWMSLPMIQTLEYDSGEQTLENATLITETTVGNSEGYMYQSLEFDMGDFPTSVISTINIKATINPQLTNKSTSYKWFWNEGGDSYHTGWLCYGSLFCQLLAFNGDTVVGASNAYNLTSPIRHNGNLWYGDNSKYSGGRVFTPYMGKSINSILGYFENKGFVAENKTSPYEFSFTINNLTNNVTALKMCYYWGASVDKLDKVDYAYTTFDKTKHVSWVGNNWNSTSHTSANYMKMNLVSHNLKAVIGSTIGRTGTEVTKNLMLNTEASPCEYFLSYAKMFGLYFSKNPYEKKISVQTRKSFYDRNTIIDISGDIDYSKNVTITPISFGSKYVEFSQEQDETQYTKEYKTTKGVAYGSKVLNTGYEFDSEKKQLLDTNVIKSAVEGLEKSKYFTCYNNDDKVRPFFGYGMKYNLYNNNDTIEVIGSNAAGSNLLGINEDANLKYYDTFPKVQFHDSSNNPTDGNNCLVFLSGFKSLAGNRANTINYFLTDDSYYQTSLNEGTPCWLFVSEDKDVNEKPVARRISEIPVFERYLTDNNGTTVKKSLDFGTPQEIYIPKYSLNEDVNIYNNFWKTYLEDLYDVNTKILTVYVRLKEQVGYNMLRQFYWFENSIWRINKITDWNIGSESTTKVEFVKVQNLNNYSSVTQLIGNNIAIFVSKYNISPNGEDIELYLTTENGGDWRLTTNSRRLILSKTQGQGNSSITVTVPQTTNPSLPTYYTITAIDNEGNTTNVNLVQGYNGETKLSVSPSALIASAIGGDYDVKFNWINQGNYEINEGYFEGDVKGNVKIDGYNATVSVTMSDEPDTVISGKVLFDNDFSDVSVGIDQIPQSLSFGKEGGEYEFIFNYNTNVKYDGLPYWIYMDGNKMKVIPNLYGTPRRSKITLSNGSSSADVQIYQELGESPSQMNNVSPENLYFNSDGGLQYVNVQIANPWVMKISENWITANVKNGEGSSIVGVSCSSNSGDKRECSITIKDTVNGKTYTIPVYQNGENTEQQISVNPSHIEATAEGGEYLVAFTYTNRNGDYVEIEGEGLNWNKLLVFAGDTATVRVIVPKNDTTSNKVYELIFKTSIGNVSVDITQEKGDSYVTIDTNNLTFGYRGGNSAIGVVSNTAWYSESSDDWLGVDVASGDVGSTEIILTVDYNKEIVDRVGYIYLKDKGTDEKLGTITVEQSRIIETLEVTPSLITFDEEGGTATIEIKSNTDWTIISE